MKAAPLRVRAVFRSEAAGGAAARRGALVAVRRWGKKVGPPALLLAAFVAAWEWAVRTLGIPFYILPAPSRIGRLLVAENGLLLAQAAVTLEEIAIGFIIASGCILSRAAGNGWRGLALTAASAALMLLTRCNPVWLLGAGGILGGIGLL